MMKSKLYGLATVCLLGTVSITPYTAYATNTNEIVQVSEQKENKNDQSTFDERMNQTLEKWNQLTEKQKKTVYQLVEKEMNCNLKVMERLCEYGVISSDDLANYNTMMVARLKQIVENEEFPYGPPKKNHKYQK